MPKPRNLASGTLILTIANMSNRVMGLAFRIFIVSLVGASTIGVFQMVYPIYLILIVVVTGGIPVAVAKLVASNDNSATSKNLVQKAITITCVLAFTMLLIVAINHDFITGKLLTDKRTETPLLLLITSVPFVAVTSVFRGYLQGKRLMGRIALIQTGEQIVRISISILLLTFITETSIETVTACLAIGIVVGEIVSCVVTYCIYLSVLNREDTQRGNHISGRAYSTWAVLALALPISLSRLIIFANQAINSSLIPHKLIQYGLTIPEATTVYGELTGMALTLFFAPSVFIISMTANLIPAISAANEAKDKKQLLDLSKIAYKAALFISTPISAIFLIYGKAICSILFSNMRAGILLSILGISSVFLHNLQVSSAILQGLGKVVHASIGSLLSTVLSIGLVVFLTPLEGIYGVALALACSFTIAGIFQLLVVNSFLSIVSSLLATTLKAIISLLPILTILLSIKPTTMTSLAVVCISTGLIYFVALYIIGERDFFSYIFMQA